MSETEIAETLIKFNNFYEKNKDTFRNINYDILKATYLYKTEVDNLNEEALIAAAEEVNRLKAEQLSKEFKEFYD